MPAVVTFDGPTKIITIINDVGNLLMELDVVEIYSEWKEWVATSDNSKFLQAFSIVGGDPLTLTRSLGVAYFLENGWRIRPTEKNHKVSLVGDIFTREPGESVFLTTVGAFTVNAELVVSALIFTTVATLTGVPTVEEIADGVWDEVLTGNTHNVNKSAGKRLRELSAQIVHTGTAQGPAVNGNQIELANDASALDGAYDPATIAIVDGTGAGQARNILQYEGATRIATVDRNWKLNPDATSEYVIYADAGREHVNEGLAQGGTATTITLNALASSIDDVYLHQTIFIRSGTGDDQVGIVVGYDGTTKIATIDGTWAVVPDTTSAYAMLPTHNNVSTEQAISFGGEVHIDTASGAAGTAYPLGTHNNPSDNIADAKTIAAAQGVDRFVVAGTLVTGPTDDISGFTFRGTNELTDAVVITAGCVTTNTVFRAMTLTGAVGGGVFAEKCALVALSNIGSDTEPSLFNDCILLESTFTYRAGLTTPQNVQFVNCVSGVSRAGGVIIDYNSEDTFSAMRKYSGAVTLVNHTDGATVWEFDTGEITIAASCTGGAIVVRGLTHPIDNSAGATVDTDGSLFPAGFRALLNAILGNVV